ncbi:class I SAM-dependent methyltransferase [Flavobacterium sp.]|uniref:class I SAM-dependent methyltransferase n=1 Tax=Flavobacterium sp. TaxID=239 RepID=UPI0037521BC5
MTKQQEILNYLKTKSKDLSFIDKLKVVYRPIICPFDELLDFVEENDTVFDIGCGSGQFCALVAKFTTANDIYGIEISEKLVQNAKKVTKEFCSNKKLQFETFDGNTIPNLIENYSKIYLIDVLHHIPKNNQEDFLKEIYLKMSVGNKLIIKDIDADSMFVNFNKLHDLVFSKEIGNEIKMSDAKKLADKIGFKVLDTYTKRMFVYPHFFLILEK